MAAFEHRPSLIYDVGVCNGDDSAYYLHKGYDVVALEANPLLIAPLRKRFQRQIDEGRYNLLEVGVAESDGEARFWVCDDTPEWSSFDQAIASRNGSAHHSVTVRTCNFGSILERFGVPHYCKIDIEGNDDLCLSALTIETKPRFVSVEVLDGDRQIERLGELGYTKFKIISQSTLRQPGPIMTSLKGHLPRFGRRVVASCEVRSMRYAPDPTWAHPFGSSGPFGDESHGRWHTAGDVLNAWRRTLALLQDNEDWHDLHAST